MDDTERRTRLIRWLEVIFSDVEDLLLDNHMFWELQEIVRNNRQFAEASGLFTQWMASAFVQATAVGVRRQAKANDNSVSLKRFLIEVQKYPSLVSREHYMSLYEGMEAWLTELGQRDFDRVAGEGSSHLPVTLAEEHLSELDQAVKKIEHYVDKRIAHYDKGLLACSTPTFADLSNALKTIEKLVVLYWKLLKGTSMTTMLSIIPFDWHDIFRFAWVPSPGMERK